MSFEGQVALQELRKRVGPCHPMQGFKVIDHLLAQRDALCETYEDLLCAQSFDKGLVVGTLEGYGWHSSQFEPHDRIVAACHALMLPSPGLMTMVQPVDKAMKLIQ